MATNLCCRWTQASSGAARRANVGFSPFALHLVAVVTLLYFVPECLVEQQGDDDDSVAEYEHVGVALGHVVVEQRERGVPEHDAERRQRRVDDDQVAEARPRHGDGSHRRCSQPPTLRPDPC